jgi:uncharacterized protein YgbK (DUF1537 family)
MIEKHHISSVHALSLSESSLENEIRRLIGVSRTKIVVLDEDLTRQINVSMAKQVSKIAKMTVHRFVLVSRGDSTLRGHYPSEIDSLTEALAPQLSIDAHLPDYIAEKSGGRWQAEEVTCLTLEEIRSNGIEKLYNKLMTTTQGVPVVVNAENYFDLKKVTLASMLAEQAGKRFLYRTAASFPKVRGAIVDKPLLSYEELVNADAMGNGGIIVVGSHVNKTTAQLQYLLEKLADVATFELDVEALLQAGQNKTIISETAQQINQAGLIPYT